MQQLSPPAYSDLDELQSCQFKVYCAQQSAQASSSSHHALTHFYFFDPNQRRFTYTSRIPKKREGWKAEIYFITEKGREEQRYEVRREPLARKFDFRPPNGMHNVMTPSVSPLPTNQKTFSIEAPDGQKLLWRKNGVQCVLVSLPSNTIIAQYDGNQSNSSSSSTTNSSAAADHSDMITIHSMPAKLHGTLRLSPLPLNDSNPVGIEQQRVGVRSSGRKIERRQSQVSNNSTSSSSTQSDRGPRLYGAHKRGITLGICGPAVALAAVGSPWMAAGMNKHCMIGDELGNLGRTTIKAPLPFDNDQHNDIDENGNYTRPMETSSYQRTAEHWASLNRIERKGKSNDPRPRRVEFDLVLASLMAVLTG